MRRGLPPGSNVGTQLRARRAKAAREAQREQQARQAQQAQQASLVPQSAPIQLALPSAEAWFAARGQTPFPFQRDVWSHIAAGRSGLLHATTGSGKTYAVYFGLLQKELGSGSIFSADAASSLRLLWITPMRALAADTARALQAPLTELGLRWRVGVRTGDTESAERARQSKQLPEVLVTTPESLTLLLTRADAPQLFARLALVVVDEWHELIGSKRGVQVQLALARVRAFACSKGGASSTSSAQIGTDRSPLPGESEAIDGVWPRASEAAPLGGAVPRPGAGAGGGGRQQGARPHPQAPLAVWGLSATIGNLDEARRTLLYPGDGVLVQGRIDKSIQVDTLLPEGIHADAGRFPWGGHLGICMVEPVAQEIESAKGTTLVFTNTRSQAELWYQALLDARPKWAGTMALHHGSLDKEVRDWVERGLKDGSLRAVVATSSLDLGVDFLPVERVLQVGSAKGVARLLQRAGRSGHAPGRVSRVTLVPTNALELIEAAAAKKAVARGVSEGKVESRVAPAKPLDVLTQHLVTVALGTGFDEAALLAEVRSTASYAALTDEEWGWALQFAASGGASLAAYPDYHRIARADDGMWRVPDAQIGRRHKLAIGTIVAESAMLVRYANGAKLGTIEESFIARLNKGDHFLFAGKLLELQRVQEMTALVTPARGRRVAVPRWSGIKLPLSSEMAEAVLEELEAALAGCYDSDEMRCVRPLLQLQARWSRIPTRRELVVELWRSREGSHLFMYPFAGRHAHIGLASLLAYRAGRSKAATFSIAVNDYGFELLAPTDIDWHALWRRPADAQHGLLREAGLLEDILASLNAGELASRRFREIARVAGLVFQGYPGQPKSTRQLQASSSLIFEVLRKYDPANRLLTQADTEVLEQELQLTRLREVLARLRTQTVVLKPLARPTPLAFPLLVERLREQLSTEKLSDRIARMVAELEQAADGATR
jgi:ATP-dependent Lhr-like helicase